MFNSNIDLHIVLFGIILLRHAIKVSKSATTIASDECKPLPNPLAMEWSIVKAAVTFWSTEPKPPPDVDGSTVFVVPGMELNGTIVVQSVSDTADTSTGTTTSMKNDLRKESCVFLVAVLESSVMLFIESDCCCRPCFLSFLI